MGSVNNKARPFGAQHYQQPLCSRRHQIGALLLVATTVFLTKLLDRSSLPCSFTVDPIATSRSSVHVTNGGELLWPHRGYGPVVDIKIYVYDEHEIDGLKALMYGRDGAIDSSSCLKGQWGTQVIFRSICYLVLALHFHPCLILQFQIHSKYFDCL